VTEESMIETGVRVAEQSRGRVDRDGVFCDLECPVCLEGAQAPALSAAASRNPKPFSLPRRQHHLVLGLFSGTLALLRQPVSRVLWAR
jgi:hypothetical protein